MAGFLGTEWGMSRAEVVAATGGLAQEYQDPRSVPMKDELVALVALTPEIQMTAFYRFYSEGTLAGMRLLPNDMTQCTSIGEMLVESYGAATRSGGPVKQWFDHHGLNIVTFSHVQHACQLDYKPLLLPTP